MLLPSAVPSESESLDFRRVGSMRKGVAAMSMHVAENNER